MNESSFTIERLHRWAEEVTSRDAVGNDDDQKAVAVEHLVELFQHSKYVPDTKFCSAEILGGNDPLFENAIKRELENEALLKIDNLVIAGGEIVDGELTKISHDELDRVSTDCPTPRTSRYAEHIKDVQRAFIWDRVSGRPAPLAAAMLRIAAIRPELKSNQRLIEKVKLKSLGEAIWEDDDLCRLCGSALGYYDGQFEPFVDYLRMDENELTEVPFGQPEVAKRKTVRSRKQKISSRKEKIDQVIGLMFLGFIVFCSLRAAFQRDDPSKVDAPQTVLSTPDLGVIK